MGNGCLTKHPLKKTGLFRVPGRCFFSGNPTLSCHGSSLHTEMLKLCACVFFMIWKNVNKKICAKG